LGGNANGRPEAHWRARPRLRAQVKKRPPGQAASANPRRSGRTVPGLRFSTHAIFPGLLETISIQRPGRRGIKCLRTDEWWFRPRRKHGGRPGRGPRVQVEAAARHAPGHQSELAATGFNQHRRTGVSAIARIAHRVVRPGRSQKATNAGCIHQTGIGAGTVGPRPKPVGRVAWTLIHDKAGRPLVRTGYLPRWEDLCTHHPPCGRVAVVAFGQHPCEKKPSEKYRHAPAELHQLGDRLPCLRARPPRAIRARRRIPREPWEKDMPRVYLAPP